MSDNRRDFLKKGALLGLSGLAGSLIGKDEINALEEVSNTLAGPLFTQAPLPYAYNAMEPFIDAKTMEIHYTKHHKGYVDKLNDAKPAGINYNVSDAEKCKDITEATPALVRNNLGGHYNHTLFWQLLKQPDETANLPKGKLAESINKKFGNFDEFKKEFSEKSTKVFGSGWCWLIIDENGSLKITTTPNQDNPLMKVALEQGKPVLALDVWEHAYYLKYQNKRADYIAGWWSIINWNKAEELFNSK